MQSISWGIRRLIVGLVLATVCQCHLAFSLSAEPADPLAKLAEAGVKLRRDAKGAVHVTFPAKRLQAGDLAVLRNHAQVRSIRLQTVELNGDLAAQLAAMPGLNSLRIESSKIAEGALGKLANARELETLSLNNSTLPNVEVSALRDFPALKHVDLNGTQTWGEPIASLQRAKPNLRIVHSWKVKFYVRDFRLCAEFPFGTLVFDDYGYEAGKPQQAVLRLNGSERHEQKVQLFLQISTHFQREKGLHRFSLADRKIELTAAGLIKIGDQPHEFIDGRNRLFELDAKGGCREVVMRDSKRVAIDSAEAKEGQARGEAGSEENLADPSYRDRPNKKWGGYRWITSYMHGKDRAIKIVPCDSYDDANTLSHSFNAEEDTNHGITVFYPGLPRGDGDHDTADYCESVPSEWPETGKERVSSFRRIYTPDVETLFSDKGTILMPHGLRIMSFGAEIRSLKRTRIDRKTPHSPIVCLGDGLHLVDAVEYTFPEQTADSITLTEPGQTIHVDFQGRFRVEK